MRQVLCKNGVPLSGISPTDGLHYGAGNAGIISLFQHIFGHQTLTRKQDQVPSEQASDSRLDSEGQGDLVKGAADKVALIVPPLIFRFRCYQVLEHFLPYRPLPHLQILVLFALECDLTFCLL